MPTTPGLNLPTPQNDDRAQLEFLAQRGDLRAKQRLLELDWPTLGEAERLRRSAELRPRDEDLEAVSREAKRLREAARADTTPMPVLAKDPTTEALRDLESGAKLAPTERLLMLNQEFARDKARKAEVLQLSQLMVQEPDADARGLLFAQIQRLLTTPLPAHELSVMYLRANYRTLMRNRERSKRQRLRDQGESK